MDSFFGIPLETIIIVLAAGTALIAVFGVYNALTVRDTLGPRAKALNDRRSKMRAEALAPRRKKKNTNQTGVSFARWLVRKLGLQERDAEGAAKLLLLRAGIRSRDALVIYLFARMAMPALTVTTTLLVIYLYTNWDPGIFVMVLVGLGAAAVGYFLPTVYVYNAGVKRRAELRKTLPDALDLLVVCTEAGLSLDAAIARVSRELGRSAPEIGEEMGIASIELNFLPERRQAFQNLAERVSLDEMRAIVSTLSQAEKYGTSVAQALRVLSNEFRTQRLLRAEEKAARLPATLTLPMVLFILPCLFVVLVGPGILRILDALMKM